MPRMHCIEVYYEPLNIYSECDGVIWTPQVLWYKNGQQCQKSETRKFQFHLATIGVFGSMSPTLLLYFTAITSASEFTEAAVC